MGEISRLRWRTFLPSREETIRITEEIGSLPPIIANTAARAVCKEAWAATIDNLRKVSADAITVPRDDPLFP
jgi:hypothetical protein